MFNVKALLLTLFFFVSGCGKSEGPKNTCDNSLNVEEIVDTLRELPDHYKIREVTQNFIYQEANEPPSYLPRRIFSEEPKLTYMRNSWLGRQDFKQDCRNRVVTTDGLVWEINSANAGELEIQADAYSNLKLIFKIVSDNSMVIIQKSQTGSLKYYEHKTLYRWGDSLPLEEDLEADFILGLYEEGLKLPQDVINQFGGNTPVQTIAIKVEDLLNLQSQIKR